MKLCVVVQGPSNNVDELKTAFDGIDIIFSTWVGYEDNYNSTDVVIFNSQPNSNECSNFLFQQKSTMSGLLLAKNRGYTHVLKIRSDMVSVGGNIFDLFVDDRLNFLCWHYHEVYPKCPGYLVDYFMYGPIDDMIKLWDVSDIFCSVPEILITYSFIKNSIDPPNFILYELQNGLDLYWIKNNIYLSSYKTTLFNDVYRKYDFGETVSHLNDSYLSFLNGAIK